MRGCPPVWFRYLAHNVLPILQDYSVTNNFSTVRYAQYILHSDRVKLSLSRYQELNNLVARKCSLLEDVYSVPTSGNLCAPI